MKSRKTSGIIALLLAVLLTPMTAYGISGAGEKPTPYIIIDDSSLADTGYFGDGSDGALYIKQGETVTLPVPVPHQSIIQKNYTSVTIEYGGTLRCSAPNAGLILRVRGDVKILGKIDQSGMAPATNPNNLFSYPPELICGNGGSGGSGGVYGGGSGIIAPGGTGMPKRPYGGGYSGGGGGGSLVNYYTKGGKGGDANNITILTELFKGGKSSSVSGSGRINGEAGRYGGGGSGDALGNGGYSAIGGFGGDAAGGNATSGEGYGQNGHRYTIGSGGGGAGNMGGGVVMIYAAGTVSVSGSGAIDCSGKGGGSGATSIWTGYTGIGIGGGGGGGGGGGAIYIRYGKSFNGDAGLKVSGGNGGAAGKGDGGGGIFATDGIAGTAGSISVKQSPPPIVNSVTVSTKWDETNTIVIAATGYGSSMDYAISGSKTTAPTVGWQSSASFTLDKNGTYYAWARDNVGLVSLPMEFTVTKVDGISPVISTATVSSIWGLTNTVSIAAADGESGLKEYAISGSKTTAPTVGWQASASFTLDKNGTYYAWARDKTNNVSLPFTLAVTKVDAVSPVISTATVSSIWGLTNTVSISATDGESGIKEYAISGSKTTAPAAGWQSSASFTLSANGTYYAWARDNVGLVSTPFEFTVTKVDAISPVISGVTMQQEWSKTSTIVIAATDGESGLKEYAISGSKTTAPTVGRQSSANFTLSTNGKYYAWAWDNVGNVSLPIEFVVNKVDAYQPSISKVTVAPGYSGSIAVDIEATDKGSGLKDFAVTTENLTPEPSVAWQTGSSFTIDKNGTYYAWARDNVGLVSSGWFFSITKIDKKPPTLSQTTFNSDRTLMMVRASDYESGVKCIYIDGAAQAGDMVSWNVPAGTRYIKIQAEDNAGNKTAELTQRVPGWFDVLDTITLEPVKFIEDNKKATVTAKTVEGDSIVGIYINGRLQKGNPVTYMIPYGTEYLELQAQNAVSDRSAIYRVRVPGWSRETDTLSITDVRFIPPGCSSVAITAMETGGVGVAGIRVNGEWQAGNPVTYEIPTGTKHLKIQAEDMNGDRSAVVIRRIPGWSEVVTTLTVTDVTFTDYNTTAKITATATGGDSVAGVIVNEKYIEGNPIIYTVPKGTETLHIQAYNPQGDKSPMINKAVPPDASKSTLKLSIEPPDWTKARSAKVKLVAADKNRITKILVRTSENNEWADVTEKRYIEITADTTVYASIENDKGEAKEVSEDIECFDRKSPKVTATQDGRTVNIRASDDKSGVTTILVNNKEYSREDIEGGSLSYRVPEGTAVVTIKAEDAAGNLSSTVELPQNTTLAVLPTIVAPTPAPTPSGELVPEIVEIPEPTMIPLATPAPEETAEIPSEPTAAATPPSEQLPPAAKAAAAVGGLGISSISGAWYWLRKKALSKPIEELELMGKKLLYDESEFGGSDDPLDKKKGE